MNRKLIALAGILLVSGIGYVVTRYPTGHEEKISYYTCPMHPQIHEDHPGDCPICHMKLVPVLRSDRSDMSDSSNGISIPPDRQQRIGLTTASVVKKAAVKEIRSSGRVAFDPDLAVAQQEYLDIAKTSPSLQEASLQHLKLMGMGEEEIRDLEQRGVPDQALTLPAAGGSVWVYAPIYENEIPQVRIGQEVEATLPASTTKLQGVIRAIDPVINLMTRTVRARIEIPGAGGQIPPESYLPVTLKIALGEQLVVPQSAVIDTGVRQVVFVIHDGDRFEAREVKLGPQAGEERVILSGLTAGETVAASAAFLIDSESQLKAAVSQKQPACPDGQVWDTSMSMCMSGGK